MIIHPAGFFSIRIASISISAINYSNYETTDNRDSATAWWEKIGGGEGSKKENWRERRELEMEREEE